MLNERKSAWNFLFQPPVQGCFCVYSDFAEHNISKSYVSARQEPPSFKDVLCMVIARAPVPKEKSFYQSWVIDYGGLSVAEIQPSGNLRIDFLDPADSIYFARIGFLFFQSSGFNFSSMTEEKFRKIWSNFTTRMLFQNEALRS